MRAPEASTTASPLYQAKFGAEEPLSARGKTNVARIKKLLPSGYLGQTRDSGALVWSGIDFREGTFTALEGASVDIASSVFGPQHYCAAGQVP